MGREKKNQIIKEITFLDDSWKTLWFLLMFIPVSNLFLDQLTLRTSSWALSPISEQPFVFQFYFVWNMVKKLVLHSNIRSIYIDELNPQKQKKKIEGRKLHDVANTIWWSTTFQCSDRKI